MELAIIAGAALVLVVALLLLLQWHGRRQIAAARLEAEERVRSFHRPR